MTASILPTTGLRQVGIRQRSLRRHCRLGRATELVFVLATGLTLTLSAGAMQAQTWDGDTDGDFITDTNWDTDVAPAAGDAVVLDTAAGNQPTLGAGDATTVDTVSVSAGTLTIAGTLTATSGVVTTGGTLDIVSGGEIAGNVSIGGLGGSNAGAISGDLEVTAGTFGNTGTVSGSTTVSGGTLNVTGAGTLDSVDVGVSGGTLLTDGGALAASAAVTVSGNGTLDVGAETVTSVSQTGGTIEGTGPLTVLDTFGQSGGDMAGTLNAGGTKTLDGGTISGALGGAGTTTVQTGTTTLTGTIGGGTVTVSSGTLAVDGGNVLTTLNVEGGTLLGTSDTTLTSSQIGSVSNTTNTFAAADGSTLTLSTNFFRLDLDSTTVIGSATETGTVIIEPINSLAVGSNADVRVAGGTLKFAASGTNISKSILTNAGGILPDRDITVDSGATIDVAGQSVSISNLAGAGTVTNSEATDVTLTLESNSDSTFSGVIEDGAAVTSVTKTLGSTLTLSGTNTYTGTTTVSGGTLALSGGSAIADSGAVVVNSGATLDVNTAETIGSLAGAGNVTLDATLTTGGDNTSTTYSGVASGSGGLTKVGTGTMTLAGANTYTGTTTVSGGTLAISSTGSIAGNVSVGSGTLRIGHSDAIGGTITTTGSVISYANGVNEASAVVVASNTTQLSVDTGDSATQSGVISQTGGARPIEKIGGGTLELAAANTYTGTTTVTGGVLNVTGSIASTAVNVGTGAGLQVDGASLLNSAAVTLSGTGNLTLTGSETIGSLASASANSTVTLGANTLTTGDAGNDTFAGVISGTGGLTKQGAGTFTLTNANTYGGTTTVSNGTLALSGSGAVASTTVSIGGAGTLTDDGDALADTAAVTNAGTFTLTGNDRIGSLNNTGGVTNLNNNAVLTLSNGTSTLGGTIAGNGGLTIVSSTANAGVALTYTGQTTVNNGGTLNLSGNGAIASTVVDINTGGTLTNDGNGLADTAAVSNSGTFTLTGNDTIGNLDNTGGVTNLNNNAVLTLSTGTSTLGGSITGNGGLTITGGTANAGVAHSYTGPTNVSGGALNLQGNGAIASTAVNVTGNGSLTTDGGGLAAGATVLVDDTGVLAVNGAETITTLTQQGGFVNGTGTLNTTAFDQSGGGVVSGTVTVNTATFTQNNGTISAGNTVNQTTSATLSGGSIVGVLGGNGAVTVQTGTTTLTGAITSTNVTVASGELSIDGGAGLAANADLTVNGGLVDVNIAETIATLNGTGGSVDIGSGNSLTLGEATGDTATYAGNVSGAGDLNKSGTNTQVLSGTNALTGDVNVTGGTLRVTGTIASLDLETAAGGTLETDGSALEDEAIVTNAGTFRITAGTETISAVNGAGGIELNTGSLTLAGATSTISGVVSGTGTLTINDAADGDASDNTTAVLSADSSGFAGTTEVTDGTLRVTSTGELGGAVNVATEGLVELQGGTLNGNLTNTGGEVEAEGTIEGNVTNNNVGAGGGNDEGMFTLTGNLAFTGTQSFTNAGTVDITAGAMTGLLSYTNQNGGLTTIADQLQATTVTNDAGGVIDLTGEIDGSLTNNGTLQVTGSAANVTGDLNNGGTVDLGSNDAYGDVLNIGGGATGAGTYVLDLNLSNGATDQILATSADATTINLQLDVDGYGYTGVPVLLFQGAQAGAAVSDGGTLAGIGGAINYGLQQTGDSVYLVSALNAGIGGVAASAALTQSLIGTIVNRPTSPFVSGLAAEETCSHGGYFRATAGQASVEGSSAAYGITTPTTLESSFWGVQGGYDFGCFDGRFFNGWDGAFGVMAGYNAGSTDQLLFSDLSNPTLTTGQLGTEFTQNYVGLYLAGGKDRISADLQLRYDDTSFDLSETTLSGAPVGLDGASYSTKSTTLGTRLNYRMDVNEAKGINFVPTVGFNVTHVKGDTITLTGGETLLLEDYTSFVGFVGGALTQTKIAEDGTSALTTFVSGNYYQDFSGDRTAQFDLDGAGPTAADPVTVASIGGFGELSLGVNYVQILDNGPAGAKQLNASVRADARFGENVSDAYSITAQVRLSF